MYKKGRFKMKEIELNVTGMHCSGCENRIKNVVSELKEVSCKPPHIGISKALRWILGIGRFNTYVSLNSDIFKEIANSEYNFCIISSETDLSVWI